MNNLHQSLMILTLLSSFHSTSAVTPYIEMHGKFLYNSETKDRFTCRGVTVSPVSVEHPQTNQIDHFINSREYEWRPIVNALEELNVNCIRIYQVCNENDPEISTSTKANNIECGPHDLFMNALQELGIYVIIPAISGPPFDSNVIKSEIPAPHCYSGKRGRNLLRTASARVIEFEKFNNTLAFNIGNELALYSIERALPAQIGILSYPCVKALSRDLKIFMKENNLRRVPTLYAMQDPAGGDVSMKNQMRYLSCLSSSKKDEEDLASVDIIGVNTYSWCMRNYTYDLVYARFVNGLPEDFDKPVMLTEFGCTGGAGTKNLNHVNNNSYTSAYPWKKNYRTWEQVPSIFNKSELGARYSGAFAYDLIMYSEMKKWQMQGERISESYGLIATKAGNNSNEALEKLPTYYALSKRYKKVMMMEQKRNVTHEINEDNIFYGCGEELSDYEMEEWLWNYFLIDRATNKKNKWWDKTAVQYLSRGSMPLNPIKALHFHIFLLVLSSVLIGILLGMRLYYKKKLSSNYYPLVEEESDLKEEGTIVTYGSLSDTEA